MDEHAAPSHPQHSAYVARLTAEMRLLHDIFCACMNTVEADDNPVAHGPTSLRHPFTPEELAAMGY